MFSSRNLPTSPAQPLPRTCRTCKTKFTTNNKRACVYHPESFSGETAQRWLPPGDTHHLTANVRSIGLFLEFHLVHETKSRAHLYFQNHFSRRIFQLHRTISDPNPKNHTAHFPHFFVYVYPRTSGETAGGAVIHNFYTCCGNRDPNSSGQCTTKFIRTAHSIFFMTNCQVTLALI